MHKKNLFRCFFIFLLLGSFAAFAQRANVKDSALFASMFTANYTFQVPGGDLKERFGVNSSIGGSFMIKFKKNWLLGVDGNFMFGDKIKDKDSILKNISTSDGHIVDGNGEFASVLMFERGFNTSFKAGKIFSVLAPNPNSGIAFIGSVGLLQHKIRIEVNQNTVTELKGDYKKGYDQLTNGIFTSEFIGYMYFGNRRLLNFYGGVEFIQAWTQCRRDFDFNTMTKDNSKRLDLLFGIKVGWTLPIYKRSTLKFYY